jgi:hypothetical protein
MRLTPNFRFKSHNGNRSSLHSLMQDKYINFNYYLQTVSLLLVHSFMSVHSRRVCVAVTLC